VTLSRKGRAVFVLALAATACPVAGFTHGGGLDAYGCHHDRKAGEYHCHNGPFAGTSFASQRDMLARLTSSSKSAPPVSNPPPAPNAAPAPTTSAPNYIPDHARTPGAINPAVTQANIRGTVCISGYTKTIRPSTAYTEELKKRQMRELGLPGTSHDYHEDHVVPLCVGGHPSEMYCGAKQIVGAWYRRIFEVSGGGSAAAGLVS
jgi:hypothetical protein